MLGSAGLALHLENLLCERRITSPSSFKHRGMQRMPFYQEKKKEIRSNFWNSFLKSPFPQIIFNSGKPNSFIPSVLEQVLYVRQSGRNFVEGKV